MTIEKSTRRLAASVGLFLAAACLASCSSGGTWVNVTAEASSSPYFSLSRPGLYQVEGGLELEGRVCRIARSTLLSPSHVRLEHIAANGSLLEVGRASVASIYRGADQACSSYATHVAWKLADGDSVRACIDRGHSCAPEAAAAAAVAVPSTPAGAAVPKASK